MKRRMSSSSCSKPDGSVKFAQPSRPPLTGNPVGIDIGTLETITFHVASDAARLSFSQVSCSRPSIVFGRSATVVGDVGVAVLPRIEHEQLDVLAPAQRAVQPLGRVRRDGDRRVVEERLEPDREQMDAGRVRRHRPCVVERPEVVDDLVVVPDADVARAPEQALRRRVRSVVAPVRPEGRQVRRRAGPGHLRVAVEAERRCSRCPRRSCRRGRRRRPGAALESSRRSGSPRVCRGRRSGRRRRRRTRGGRLRGHRPRALFRRTRAPSRPGSGTWCPASGR